MKTLHLTLIKKWFDAIFSGEKTEEYREIKPYWIPKLAFQTWDRISFRNGYASDAPTMLVECHGMRLAEFQGNPVFALKLGKILEVKNVKSSNHIGGHPGQNSQEAGLEYSSKAE